MSQIARETLGVGFIGTGDISILHAAAVKKCPGAKLLGRLEPHAGHGEETGRRVRLQSLRQPRGHVQ